MEEDNKPKLTLVKGDTVGNEAHKAKARQRTGKTESGLTEKQEAFAQGLSSGLSNSDAYRQAYDASKMKDRTIHAESCALAARPDISARVQALIAEKRKRNSISTEKQHARQSERIWGRIWSMLDDPQTPPAVKANLLSLSAKAAGMLTDQVQIESISANSKDIESELIERLQRLRA